MSRSQSSASTQSQADVGSILPSYTGRSFEERSSSRASTSSPTKSILKKSHGSSSSHSKTNFLSGEIPSEDSANAYLQYIQPANILRRPSQATRNHPDQSNERLRIATPPIAGTSFVTGSIDLAPSSTRTSSFTSRSPLSSPPIPALPSRFTRTTSPSAGPGSTYRNAEPNPFFAQRSFVRTASAEMSPRSSLSSSKSNQSSLRWSSESCKTASTSRSISQPVLLSEVLEIKHKSPQDTSRSLQTKIDENDEGPKPPAFSWLSFDEDEVNVSENFPPVQRKNSLWRESLDSTTSSHFDLLEDKEDIRARHFPTPPPMSRSNSVATTMTPESEKRDPLKPTEEDSHVQGTPYQQNQLPDTSRPSKQPPTSSSKASVSEMLRVHLASPLRRNKSPRSGESRDGDLTDRKNRQPFRSGSSSNSSSTTVTNRV